MWYIMRNIYFKFEDDILRNKKVVIKIFYCIKNMDALIKPIQIEKCILVLEQVAFFILGGLYC